MYRANRSNKNTHRRTISITCAALGLCLLAGAAQAEDVAVALSGQVTLVDDQGGLLAGNAVIGQPFSGEYIYDNAAADTNPDPALGAYRFSSAPYGIAFTVGALDFQTDPARTDLLIEVANDFGPPWDIFGVRSLNNLTLPDGMVIERITWQIEDTTASAIDSDALFQGPPLLADWQQSIGVTIAGCNAAAFDGFACEEDPARGKYVFTIGGVITSATAVDPTPVTLEELIAKVQALPDKTAMKVLLVPLLKAQRILRDNKPENDYLVCDTLTKFIEKVTKALEAGRIDQATADELIDDALLLQAESGCL